MPRFLGEFLEGSGCRPRNPNNNLKLKSISNSGILSKKIDCFCLKNRRGRKKVLSALFSQTLLQTLLETLLQTLLVTLNFTFFRKTCKKFSKRLKFVNRNCCFFRQATVSGKLMCRKNMLKKNLARQTGRSNKPLKKRNYYEQEKNYDERREWLP